MRVITGLAKGRKLLAPEGENTRPTSDMAKEGIFSIIQFELAEATVLDLFAGSGQLGIEALSRGARHCVFVDQSRQAQEIIRQNLQNTGLSAQSRVAAMDYGSYLDGCKDRFDIVLMDPPYQKGLAQDALLRVAEKMKDTGVIVCETEKNEVLPEQAGEFQLFREYRYGKAKVTVYRKKDEE